MPQTPPPPHRCCSTSVPKTSERVPGCPGFARAIPSPCARAPRLRPPPGPGVGVDLGRSERIFRTRRCCRRTPVAGTRTGVPYVAAAAAYRVRTSAETSLACRRAVSPSTFQMLATLLPRARAGVEVVCGVSVDPAQLLVRPRRHKEQVARAARAARAARQVHGGRQGMKGGVEVALRELPLLKGHRDHEQLVRVRDEGGGGLRRRGRGCLRSPALATWPYGTQRPPRTLPALPERLPVPPVAGEGKLLHFRRATTSATPFPRGRRGRRRCWARPAAPRGSGRRGRSGPGRTGRRRTRAGCSRRRSGRRCSGPGIRC